MEKGSESTIKVNFEIPAREKFFVLRPLTMAEKWKSKVTIRGSGPLIHNTLCIFTFFGFRGIAIFGMISLKHNKDRGQITFLSFLRFDSNKFAKLSGGISSDLIQDCGILFQ